jgi:hypothetical protein
MTLDLGALKRLEREATKGPWDVIQGGLVRAVKVEDDFTVPIFRSEAPIDWYKKKNLTHKVMCAAYADEVNNANFIAAARTALPKLIEQVEAHRKREADLVHVATYALANEIEAVLSGPVMEAAEGLKQIANKLLSAALSPKAVQKEKEG